MTTHTRMLTETDSTPLEDGLVDGSDSVVVDTFQWTRQQMSQIVADVAARLDTIHPLQGHPKRFQGLIVHHEGTPTPLHQLAQLSTPKQGQLRIRLYDPRVMAEVETALAQVGFQGQISESRKAIVLQMPEITPADRQQMTKELHRIIEQGRVLIRAVRRKAMDRVREQETDSNRLELERHHVQEITDQHIGYLSELCHARQKEIEQLG